jgi:hypothetical protein
VCFSDSCQDQETSIVTDVIENRRGNVTESVKWKRPETGREMEAALLLYRLTFLSRESWNTFVSENSLAATIFAYL